MASSAAKLKVICPNCDEHSIVVVWNEDVRLGYFCESQNPLTRDHTRYYENICGRLVSDEEYKELKGIQHHGVAPPNPQQQQMQAQTNENTFTAPRLGVNFQPLVVNRAKEILQRASQNNGQRLQPIVPLREQRERLQNLQYQQHEQSHNSSTPLTTNDLTNPKQRALTFWQKRQSLANVNKEVLVEQNLARLRAAREAAEEAEQRVSSKTKTNVLKHLPRNTSSEEEIERIAELKRKGKFKPPKPKKKKKKANKALDSKTKKNADDESDDYDDESEDGDGSGEEGGWDSDADEAESDSDDSDPEGDEDGAMFPETAEDRLEEEADRLNALMGDNEKLLAERADDIFTKGAKIQRVDVMSPSHAWESYGNDQYEVYRAPFDTPQMDPRFLELHQASESKRYATLSVNWNSLTPAIKNTSKWKPVEYKPKVQVDEKDEKQLALEDYQQNRLAKALQKRPIPADYKPLVVWSPSQETLDRNPNVQLSPIEVPPIVGHWLRPHQREGVQFLAECVLSQRGFRGAGCILADDMGLGKTLQSVALIYTLLTQGFMSHSPVCKKVIVCCPTSLVQNWANEFDKWIGRGVVYVVPITEGGEKQKKALRKFTHGQGQVLVLSYETLRRNLKTLLGDTQTGKKKNQPQKTADDDELDALGIEGSADVNDDGGADGEGAKVKTICDLLICDEAHRLKNSQTQTYLSLNELPCARRILLSGTPMQNELKEFYSMINFANPGLLGTLPQFSAKFQNPIIRGREPDAPRNEKVLGEERAFELSRIVGKFIIRRTNTLLSKHLPPKTIEMVCTSLSPLQESIYRTIINQKSIRDFVKSGGQNDLEAAFAIDMSGPGDEGDDESGKKGKSKKGKGAGVHDEDENDGPQILPMLNMLRGVSNHPKIVFDQLNKKRQNGIFGDFEKSILSCYPPSFALDGAHPRYSGKMFALDRLICAVRAQTKDRFVLISNFTETLDIVQQMCEYRNLKWLRVDGGTSVKQRQANVDKLCAKDSSYAVFLLSSKAGGCGLNLVGANRLVLIDPDWNPAVDKQAAGRIWRDGQPKRCFVYRMFSTGTVEEKIFQRQLSKDGLTEIMGGSNQDANVSTAELRRLFEYNPPVGSDTHETLDCHCCSAHPVEEGSTTTLVGEKPDYQLNLWTSDTNPFGRPTAHPLDPSLCRYPYQLSPDESKPKDPNGMDNGDEIDPPSSVPRWVDPSLDNSALLASAIENANQKASTHPKSRLQPMDPSTQNSHSSSSQTLPNLLQKNWALESDLEYWSHHSNLSTVPDPMFRDALIDRFTGKPNWEAFGDRAQGAPANLEYSCQRNTVSMVMALEVTGKPLVDDPDGRKWRQFSSLTFRHGKPIKAIVKGNNYSNVISIDENDLDDEDLTAAQRKKKLERLKKLEKKQNVAKFDPTNFTFDSEDDIEDYTCAESKPKGVLPDTYLVDPEELAARRAFRERQTLRITNTRGDYMKLITRAKVPGRGPRANSNSNPSTKAKAAPKSQTSHTNQSSQSSGSEDGEANSRKKRQKGNQGKKSPTKPKHPTRKAKVHKDGNDDGDGVTSDNDRMDDADARGNLAGLIGSDSDQDLSSDNGSDGEDSLSDESDSDSDSGSDSKSSRRESKSGDNNASRTSLQEPPTVTNHKSPIETKKSNKVTKPAPSTPSKKKTIISDSDDDDNDSKFVQLPKIKSDDAQAEYKPTFLNDDDSGEEIVLKSKIAPKPAPPPVQPPRDIESKPVMNNHGSIDPDTDTNNTSPNSKKRKSRTTTAPTITGKDINQEPQTPIKRPTRGQPKSPRGLIDSQTSEPADTPNTRAAKSRRASAFALGDDDCDYDLSTDLDEDPVLDQSNTKPRRSQLAKHLEAFEINSKPRPTTKNSTHTKSPSKTNKSSSSATSMSSSSITIQELDSDLFDENNNLDNNVLSAPIPKTNPTNPVNLLSKFPSITAPLPSTAKNKIIARTLTTPVADSLSTNQSDDDEINFDED